MEGSDERTPLLRQQQQQQQTVDETVASEYQTIGDEEQPIVQEASPEDEQKPESFFKKVCGIVLVMFAGMVFTGSNCMQKFLVKNATFWQLLGNRAIIQTILMIVACLVAKVRHQTQGNDAMTYMTAFLGPYGMRKRTALQGILGGVLLTCMFVAIKYVPLGNASAIMFCTPLFTFFMAPCMLKERYGLYRGLISVFMMTGVLLITRPPFIFPSDNTTTNITVYNSLPQTDSVNHQTTSNGTINVDNDLLGLGTDGARPTYSFFGNFPAPMHKLRQNEGQTDESQDKKELQAHYQQYVGYCCCVSVPLLSALISIITRQCNVQKVPVHVLMFWFGVGALLCLVVGTASKIATNVFNVSGIDATIMVAITALGLTGNCSYTLAVKWVSPSLANVFRSFEVILNFVLQLEFEHSVFHAENAVGIVLLLLSVVIMAYEERVKRRYPNNRFL